MFVKKKSCFEVWSATRQAYIWEYISNRGKKKENRVILKKKLEIVHM